MENKYLYGLPIAIAAVALGNKVITEQPAHESAQQSDSITASASQMSSNAKKTSKASTQINSNQQASLIKASTNTSIATLDYPIVEAKYIDKINEESSYGRTNINTANITNSKRHELQQQPDTIVLKHRAFKVNQNYTGNDKFFYLITKKPITQSQFDTLESMGVDVVSKIQHNVWVVSTNGDSKKAHAILDLPFVAKSASISPIDNISPSTLTKFNHARNGRNVEITLYKENSANEFLKQTGLKKATVTDNGKSITTSISKDKLLTVASNPNVSWVGELPAPKISTSEYVTGEYISDDPTYSPTNEDSASLSGVDKVHDKGYEGKGINISLWDGGQVAKHQELKNRVINMEKVEKISSHATHVSGTMIATGIWSRAKGMAPKASKLYSYDFYDDIYEEFKELNTLKKDKVRLSNHSYGSIAGWFVRYIKDPNNPKKRILKYQDTGSELFGLYDSESSKFDKGIKKFEHVFVKSAGNDRTDCSPDGKECDGKTFGGEDGYFTIGPVGSAKNVITVGAGNDDGDGVTSFSSYGPTLDGRIKPDIVADGSYLISTSKTAEYSIKSGTSMSAPVVTGSSALLLEAYKKNIGKDPKAATIKAIMIQTAKDLLTEGPDYKTGWGLLKVDDAVQLIEDDKGRDGYIREGKTLFSGQTQELTYKVWDDSQPFKLTVAWSDKEGSPKSAFPLVNDLDVKLISPSGITYLPWTLNGDRPHYPAVKGVNKVDNIEQIVAENPELGDWRLIVTATSTDSKGQDFSIASNQFGKNVPKIDNISHVKVSSKNLKQKLSGFSKPVILATTPTFRGYEGGVINIFNVNNNSFSTKFSEWDYLNGKHGEEFVSFSGFDSGSYLMPDGTELIAGKFDLKSSGALNFERHLFPEEFDDKPYVFVQQQSKNDKEISTVRIKNVTSEGFDVAISEQESLSNGHAKETIGYVAILPPKKRKFGTLVTNGKKIRYSVASGKIGSSWKKFSVNYVLEKTIHNIKFEMKFQEEQSRDKEVRHINEEFNMLFLGNPSKNNGLEPIVQTTTTYGSDNGSLRIKKFKVTSSKKVKNKPKNQ